MDLLKTARQENERLEAERQLKERADVDEQDRAAYRDLIGQLAEHGVEAEQYAQDLLKLLPDSSSRAREQSSRLRKRPSMNT